MIANRLTEAESIKAGFIVDDTGFSPNSEGIDHINIDPTSCTRLGRSLSILTEHERIESILGLNYTCFRTVDRFLQLPHALLNTSRELMDTPKHVANDVYRVLLHNKLVTGKVQTAPILMFLMWERAKLSPTYHNLMLEVFNIYNDTRIVSYSAITGKDTSRKRWLIPVYISVSYAIAHNKVPEFSRVYKGKGNWYDFEGYDGDILSDIATVSAYPPHKE